MENRKVEEESEVGSSTQANSLNSPPDVHKKDNVILSSEIEIVKLKENRLMSHQNKDEASEQESQNASDLEESKDTGKNQTKDQILHEEKEPNPVNGSKTPVLEVSSYRNSPDHYMDSDQEVQSYAWPEKASALKNFVKEKGAVAISTVFRRLSGKKDEDEQELTDGEEMDDIATDGIHEFDESSQECKAKDDSLEQSSWNPLNFIKIPWDLDKWHTSDQESSIHMEHPTEEPIIKGKIIVYTRLRCQDSKLVRLFMHQKRLKYIEINVDIYPSRKLELEKNTGTSVVPRIYFNDLLIGSLSDLKILDESGKLDENISYVFNEEPSPAAPLPPLPGEDDVSGSGMVDESATIVRKMKEVIALRDRFYKMRRFSNCFVGSKAVDFLSEDQYLEREEAVEFGRKLVEEHFFQHVLDENTFEDSNHLYRFLEHDPVISKQCYNISKGLIDVKPKPVTEIGSRLKLISCAIFEAYVSEDGKHVDYRSIRGSEEFRRYLRIIDELHRVKLGGTSREEKLSFFINLYNMMSIHAILTWGYPGGPLERRKFSGDFKYVLGGSPYSLSAIYNGILRGNRRPPYNLSKPFGAKDKRAKVALLYPEPLVHFAIVSGTRSGPPLRCYSPGNIDDELMEAARNFLKNGGIFVNAEAKLISASKILKWFGVDFGEKEVEVIKHAANYIEPSKAEELLELLAYTQLKVTYQKYDWGLND